MGEGKESKRSREAARPPSYPSYLEMRLVGSQDITFVPEKTHRGEERTLFPSFNSFILKHIPQSLPI